MIRNMCYAKTEMLAALDHAAVGVLAFIGADGRPRACPVTPYVDAGEAVVSSTLAFTAKVAAVRNDPRVALLAGGCLIRARATVGIDLTSKTFDEHVRAQELRKYPPARRLLAIPGHRRLLWWYVGRASIRIPLAGSATAGGTDRVTLTVVVDGLPSILALDPSADACAGELPVPAGVEGPACVLFHEEDDQMADLRQLTLHGTISDGVFHVERRVGSLAPGRPSALGELKTLRSLARQARRKRPVFERWTRPPGDPAVVGLSRGLSRAGLLAAPAQIPPPPPPPRLPFPGEEDADDEVHVTIDGSQLKLG
jgi:hypothetical protein